MIARDTQEFEVIKAVRAVIPLEESTLDVYMLPAGDKRLGIEGVGIALGYTKRWFYDSTNKKSKWLEGLKGTGFKGTQQSLEIIPHDDRSPSIFRTISIRDFIKLVTYEAIIRKNIKAIILLASFAEIGLEKVIEDVFAGRSIEFLLEKIVHYSQWTYEDLEQVLSENRADVKALYPWCESIQFNEAPHSLI
jgi:hypothetical protein